jgi:hypothetical protein
MERNIILKWLKIFSIGYIIIFAIELLNLILFSNVIILSINSEQITISYLLFNSGYVDLQLAVLWIFYGITSAAFLILGVALFRIAKQNKRQNLNLAKTLLITGLFIIIANLFKYELIYLINKTLIDIGGFSAIFMNVIYNTSITPIVGAWMWFILTIITLTVLISSLIISAVGLQWGILQFKQQKTE